MTVRRLVLLILMACVRSEVHAAYAAFDDLQVPTPTWMQLPGPDVLPVNYRISRWSDHEALVELRATAGPLDLHWCLPGYQQAALAFTTHVAPGEPVPVRVPLQYLDQGLFRLRLGVSRDGSVPAPICINAATAAYAVNVPGITARFRAESLGYTVSLREGVADLHVRNFGAEPIHCDIALAGFQDPAREHNPRLHLLPGSTTEMLIPLATPDPRIAHAVVDVWNLVIGAEDRGGALISAPRFADYLLPQDGWFPVGVLGEAEGSVHFNPRVVCWQADGDRLRLRNRSSSVIATEVQVRLGERMGQVTVELPPDATIAVPAPLSIPSDRRPFVALTHLVVDGVPVRRSIQVFTAAVVPEQALPITPRHADPRFNPLTLAYVLERAGEGRARVMVINRSAISVHADCAIAGYQAEEPANPRLHLPPGQSATVELSVTRSDVRLALARVLVWNVRLGEDSGEMLVAAR